MTNGSMSIIISKSEFAVSSTVTSSSRAIRPTLYSRSKFELGAESNRTYTGFTEIIYTVEFLL